VSNQYSDKLGEIPLRFHLAVFRRGTQEKVRLMSYEKDTLVSHVGLIRFILSQFLKMSQECLYFCR